MVGNIQIPGVNHPRFDVPEVVKYLGKNEVKKLREDEPNMFCSKSGVSWRCAWKVAVLGALFQPLSTGGPAWRWDSTGVGFGCAVISSRAATDKLATSIHSRGRVDPAERGGSE